MQTPHIDLIAPDIYREDLCQVCREYDRLGNPLLIPETTHDERSASYVYYALGRHNALGFSPFGIDDIVDPEKHPLSECYRILSGMIIPVIARSQGTGRIMGFVDDGTYGYSHMASMWRTRVRVRGFECDLGGYRLRVSFTRELMERMKTILPSFQYEARITSEGLIIAVEDDTYIAVGVNFMLRFLPRDSFSSNV